MKASTTPLDNTGSNKHQVSSSSSVKVGIAIGIVLLILLVVSLCYWKRRTGMFTFRPLGVSDDLAELINNQSTTIIIMISNKKI